MKVKREQAEREEEEARIRQIKEDKEHAKEERNFRPSKRRNASGSRRNSSGPRKERIKQEQAVRKIFYGTTTKSKYKTPIEHWQTRR